MFNPIGSLIVGVIAGGIVIEGSGLVERMQIDDPVGAIAVHGVCGTFGVIAVGLFAAKDVDGVRQARSAVGWNARQLGSQLIGAVAPAWTVGIASILFFLLKRFTGLRVPEAEEYEGLDIHEHGMPGYAGDVVPPPAPAAPLEPAVPTFEPEPAFAG